MVTVLVESIAGQQVGLKTISQKIIDLEEQKGEIEQEMMENEAPLAQAKQKAVSVALWEQKFTTFEEIFSEATPEERKGLLRLHINYLIYPLMEFLSLYFVPVVNRIGQKFSEKM